MPWALTVIPGCMSGLPWREIIGTRNRLAHAYLGMDADTVWDIVSNELPQLRDALTALLAQL